MKLQQVEWFAARRREIAMASRAADRKRMIAELDKAGDPLARDFRLASERAAAAARVARSSGDYPLLARGDLNLYSLFVERAITLVRPNGMVGLLVPSGIASDKTAAPFFKSRRDRRQTQDTLRLREQEDLLPGYPRVLQVLRLRCESQASSQPCTVRLLPT